VRYSTVKTTTSKIDPVSLDAVKAHLKITDDSENEVVAGFIKKAVDFLESRHALSFTDQTFEMRLDSFPCGEIEIPIRPVLSVESVRYRPADAGAEAALATSEYEVDTKSFLAAVYPAYSKAWPSTLCIRNAVTVTFKAGYGTAAEHVPARIKEALLLLIGHYHQNREATLAGGPPAEAIVFGVDALLACETRIQV
jgi:uncharacterized phiE125 gp8 family phage protein